MRIVYWTSLGFADRDSHVEGVNDQFGSHIIGVGLSLHRPKVSLTLPEFSTSFAGNMRVGKRTISIVAIG